MSVGHSEIFIDPLKIQKTIEKLQQERTVLLKLPAELMPVYGEALKKRFDKLGVNVRVVPHNAVELGTESYDLEINFNQRIEKANKEKGIMFNPDNKSLFSFKSLPENGLETDIQKLELCQTNINNRYTRLSSRIREYEASDGLIFLSKLYHLTCRYILSIDILKADQERLNKKISAFKCVIFHGILHVLLEAIEKSTHLVRLKNVMKRYVRIILVDDIGDKTCDELVSLGFCKRRIKVMSTSLFGRLYKQFRYKKMMKTQDSSVGLKAMLTECDAFDDFEIMIYNPWKYENGKLEVEVGIRKNLLLNKKESEIGKKSPESIYEEMVMLDTQIQESKETLGRINEEIKELKINGHENRNKIKTLEREKKKHEQRVSEDNHKLGDIQRVLKQQKSITLYRRDLVDVIKQAASHDFTTKLMETFHDFSNSERTFEEKLSSGNIDIKILKKQTKLVKRKRKSEKKISMYNHKLKNILNSIDFYKKEYGLRHDLDIQKELGIHTLNCIEHEVLRNITFGLLDMIYPYPGPFFKIENNNEEPLDWNCQSLENIRLYIASKRKIPWEREIDFFFRISPIEKINRVSLSRFIPGPMDVAEKNYQLFIIDYSVLDMKELCRFIELRNRNGYGHVPVILTIPEKISLNETDRLKLAFLTGLKQGENNELYFEHPVFTIKDNVEAEMFFSSLSEVFGIAAHTVPEFKKADTEPLEKDVKKIPEDVEPAEKDNVFEETIRKEDALDSDSCSMEDRPLETEKSTIQNLKGIKIHIDIPAEQEMYAVDAILGFEDEERETADENRIETPGELNEDVCTDSPNPEKPDQDLTTDGQESSEGIETDHLF